MQKMNNEKWLNKAMKKVATMSAKQKIAMLQALDITFYKEVNVEVMHDEADIMFYEDLAEKYGIQLLSDEE